MKIQTSLTRYYRLPGGVDTTTSRPKYYRKWKKLIRAIQKATGWTVRSYDPDLSLSRMRKLPDGTVRAEHSIQIPVEFANKILELKRKADSGK